MVGENGIGALYAGPDYAARTWQAASRFIEEGGRGLFTRPATEMKCAGAPLKHTFLIDDRLTRAEAPRGRADRLYRAADPRSSACPSWPNGCACFLTTATSITPTWRTLRSIDAGRRSPHSPTPTGHPRRGVRLPPRHPAAACTRVRAPVGSCLGRPVDRPGLGRLRPSHAAPQPLRQHLGRGRRGGRAEGQDGGEREMAGAGGRGSPRGRDRRRPREPRPTTATPPVR
jgi:hypothetical protein